VGLSKILYISGLLSLKRSFSAFRDLFLAVRGSISATDNSSSFSVALIRISPVGDVI